MSSADFTKPVTTDTYTNVLAEIRDLTDSLAKMLDGTADSNTPTDAIRINSGQGFRLEKYDGATWNDVTPQLGNLAAELTNLTTAEVNQLVNIGSTTISATQWAILGSLLASAAELNILNGINGDVDTASVNNIGGLSIDLGTLLATAAEINILSGINGDVDTASLNNIGGLTVDLGPLTVSASHLNSTATSGGGNFPNVNANVSATDEDIDNAANYLQNIGNNGEVWIQHVSMEYGIDNSGNDVESLSPGETCRIGLFMSPLVPVGKVCRMRVARGWVGSSSLKLELRELSSPSWAEFDSSVDITGNQHQFGEDVNKIMLDNTAGGSTQTGQWDVYLVNTSGSSTINLVAFQNFSCMFTLEDS